MVLSSLPISSFLIFLPLVEVIWLLLIGQGETSLYRNIEQTARWSAVVNVFVVVSLLIFEPAQSGLFFEEQHTWLNFGWGQITYHVGVDAIGSLFAFLSVLMVLVIVMVASSFIHRHLKFFFAFVFFSQFCLFGMFFSQDVFLFLIFFELSAIVLFLLVSFWENGCQKKDSYRMLIYTLVGSTITFALFFYLFAQTGTSTLSLLPKLVGELPIRTQVILLLLLFFSLAIKIPLWPLHRWMPSVYAESSTPTTMLFLLMKVGFFALLRLVLGLFPQALGLVSPYILIFLFFGVVVMGFTAYREEDMKKKLSFFSVAHMNLLVMALLSGTKIGILGAIYGFFTQTLSKGGLFLFFGYVEKQKRTRNIANMGGLAQRIPLVAIFSMIFLLSVIALPSTGVFVAELRSITALVEVFPLIGVLTLLFSVILTTIGLLSLYRRVFLGPDTTDQSVALEDVKLSGVLAGLILVVGILWTGLSSTGLDRLIKPFANNLAVHAQKEKEKPFFSGFVRRPQEAVTEEKKGG